MTPWGLVAQAAPAVRTTYEWTRLEQFGERWHWLLLALGCAAIVAYVAALYRRDAVEAPRPVGWMLAALRVVALGGLLLYWLGLERRDQTQVVVNSRVVVLVDTSQSMAVRDVETAVSVDAPNRLEQVVKLLDERGLLTKLRETHDVVLARFDEQMVRLALLPKGSAAAVPANGANAAPPVQSGDNSGAPRAASVEWRAALVPSGVETRLGQALRQVINDERAAPLAGVVALTDGGQNTGVDPQAAIAAAQEARVPIFTVGLGSDRRPANARVADLAAPVRAYPGDSFTITGYLHAEELDNRLVDVELYSQPAAGGDNVTAPRLEGSQRVTLGTRGEAVPVKFDITPAEVGRRTFRLQISPPTEDTVGNDNRQEVDVEIVDRKTKVLLAASGPMRDFIYLRNQLFRDPQMTVDVWLQSAQSGTSQDAHHILDEFPATAQELFEYDAIVAFDVNWLEVPDEAIANLERWVAERAGGLVLVAGPVEMNNWVQDAKYAKLRGLFPVEFNRRLSALDDARFGAAEPQPLQFTREGLEAEFLWLADTATQSQQAWSAFPGVFGYFDVKGPKPGATVYARFPDPNAPADQAPVYLAGQFYGAGRVFYLGSGETWRLRALDDNYFNQFYTKLVRHVSQGRLLAGSSRGMLLVDRDRYLLGSPVQVRAQITDARFEPLTLPQLTVDVIRPDGSPDAVVLRPDAQRAGLYQGQFAALAEGTYRLELAVPDVDERLARRIHVAVPDLERQRPERNDALLAHIAQATGGLYYVGADAVLGGSGAPPLLARLPDRTKQTYLAGVKDLEFAQRWMQGLLVLVCGALCLEWLIRRLSKLA